MRQILRPSTSGWRARARRGEAGQTLVEYALIIAVVSLGSLVALGFLSGEIQSLFSKAGNSINDVAVAAPSGGAPGPEPATAAPAGGGVAIFAYNNASDANADVNRDSSPDAGDYLRVVTSGWSAAPNNPTSYTFTWHRDQTPFANCTSSVFDSGGVPNFETLVTGPTTTSTAFQVIGPAAISILADPYRATVTATNAVGTSTAVTFCLNVS
jgi:Flp pilus assembly pilin Flp